jgi:ParB-like chromosome segregation protein Spo0J
LGSLILKVGFTRPIVVDELDQVLAGHGALEAARKVKLERVPVSIVGHLTAAEKRAYMLADNKLAEMSQWNKLKVSEELAELDLAKFDFTMTGFSDRELEQMLEELAGPPALEQHRGNRMTTEFNKPPQTPASNASAPAAKAAAAPAAAAPSPVVQIAVISDDQKSALGEIHKLATELNNKIHALELAGSREISLAKTKLEEAMHWVSSHLVKTAPPAK